MYSQASMPRAGLAFRFSRAGILLLAGLLFALSTQAKLSLYHQDGPTKYLSNAAKMKECRAQGVEAPFAEKTVEIRADDSAREFCVAPREVVLPRFFSLVRPFEFRPPPAAR